jgi:hypothetical protein
MTQLVIVLMILVGSAGLAGQAPVASSPEFDVALPSSRRAFAFSAPMESHEESWKARMRWSEGIYARPQARGFEGAGSSANVIVES